jgi:DNA polymerase-3 subunit gamma/tau
MMTDPKTSTGYRVLARKYRPASFDQLIGQESLVRTLENAIRRDALAHAYLFTGVRGVGKTSTARLLARALNCIGPDGKGGPTIQPCGVCEPCVGIAASRHIDVLEMDAASHTGVDDVREIIEASRYAAVSARYKIYIIDEVHMLSRNAFNALLKTLEEPPAHVKFIFATTEVQKLPVTVLSRCQRFDLRRIPPETLAAHFAQIVRDEGAEAEEEALALIARAADGSARDGLSILDQAIAHGGGVVRADAVREMIGLSDPTHVRELMRRLLAGEARAALEGLRAQYEMGAAPEAIFRALLDLVHSLTRAKIELSPGAVPDSALRVFLEETAAELSFTALHRLWQVLLKGLAEVEAAPVPIQAAEMALLRAIHAAGLPDPLDLLRDLEGGDAPRLPARPSAERTAREPVRAVPVPVGGAPGPPGPEEARLGVGQGESSPAPETGQAGAAEAGAADEFAESVPTGVARPAAGPPPSSASPAAASQLVHGAEAEAAAPEPSDFASFVMLFDEKLEPRIAQLLHDDVRLIRYAPPHVEFSPGPASPPDLAQRVMRCLASWTGQRWTVSVSDKGGGPTLRELEEEARERERQAVLAEPLVRALFESFPEAELREFGRLDAASQAAAARDRQEGQQVEPDEGGAPFGLAERRN